jgi:hypothetical protein
MLMNKAKLLKSILISSAALLLAIGLVWISRAQPPVNTGNAVVTVASVKSPTVNVTSGIPTRSIVDWSTAQASVPWNLASPTQLPEGFALTQIEKFEFGAPIGVSFISTFKRLSDDAAFMIRRYPK